MESIVQKLKKPLDQAALKPLYKGSHLSAISPMYIIERLNDVFGVENWVAEEQIIKEIETQKGMYVVARVTLKCRIDENSVIVRSQYGGNENPMDIGDSYKGAVTDALTKCASMIGIGQDVYKGNQSHNKAIAGDSISSTNLQKEEPFVKQTPSDSSVESPLPNWINDQITCGYLKGKTYQDISTDKAELVKQQVYWKSNAKTDDQKTHLDRVDELLKVIKSPNEMMFGESV